MFIKSNLTAVYVIPMREDRNLIFILTFYIKENRLKIYFNLYDRQIVNNGGIGFPNRIMAKYTRCSFEIT